MSNYNSLKTTINANIKQNGVQAITGNILNSVLNAMVTTLGTGYQFAGVATTATTPGSPDAKVFYIANGKGTYTNFGGIEVTEDDVVVLYWDSSWHKVSTGIATQEKILELAEIIGVDKRVDVDIPSIPYRGGYVDGGGSHQYKYSTATNTTYSVCLVPLNGANKVVVVGGGDYSMVSFVINNDAPTSDSPIDTIGYINIVSNDEKTLDVPQGCNYLIFNRYYSRVFRSPSSITLITEGSSAFPSKQDFEELEDKVSELETTLDDKVSKEDIENIVDGLQIASVANGYAIYPSGAQTTSSVCNTYTIKNEGYNKIIAKVGGGSTAFLSLAFYSDYPSSQASFMSGVNMTSAGTRTIESDVPVGCKAIAVVNRTTYLAVPTITLYSTLKDVVSSNTERIKNIEEELGDKTDIISLNNPIETQQKLTQLKFIGGVSSTNPKPLVLIHFSDIHGGNTETRYLINKTILERIVAYKNEYSQYIDDILCTGDICFNMYSDRLPNGTTPNWWDLVDGSENIMVAIGNHDTSVDGSSWSSVPQTDVCNTFVAPYADNWGVERPSGKNYYYKDYMTQGIRLIVIDPYYSDDDELTWFSNALNTTNSVVVAMHPPFNNSTLLDCTFNSLRWDGTFNQHIPYQQYVDIVTEFINGGGDFICWLHGHVHGDVTSVYEQDGTRQLVLGAPSAKAPRNATATSESNNCDVRILNSRSMDSFNVVGIDTLYHTITLMRVGSDNDVSLRHRGVCSIDYKTCKVLFND